MSAEIIAKPGEMRRRDEWRSCLGSVLVKAGLHTDWNSQLPEEFEQYEVLCGVELKVVNTTKGAFIRAIYDSFSIIFSDLPTKKEDMRREERELTLDREWDGMLGVYHGEKKGYLFSGAGADHLQKTIVARELDCDLAHYIFQGEAGIFMQANGISPLVSFAGYATEEVATSLLESRAETRQLHIAPLQ
jgi:hypothetical protein